jgi:hypothetical protein
MLCTYNTIEDYINTKCIYNRIEDYKDVHCFVIIEWGDVVQGEETHNKPSTYWATFEPLM